MIRTENVKRDSTDFIRTLNYIIIILFIFNLNMNKKITKHKIFELKLDSLCIWQMTLGRWLVELTNYINL